MNPKHHHFDLNHKEASATADVYESETGVRVIFKGVIPTPTQGNRDTAYAEFAFYMQVVECIPIGVPVDVTWPDGRKEHLKSITEGF